jgi:hypothetical protein
MPIHIGILLDILLKDKYDILSQFYPLQEYPKQQKVVDKITIELENALIEILDKTKTQFLFSSIKNDMIRYIIYI